MEAGEVFRGVEEALNIKFEEPVESPRTNTTEEQDYGGVLMSATNTEIVILNPAKLSGGWTSSSGAH